MSLSRRMILLDWARQAGAWILEDDYDSEYRFSGRPLEALQGLDHDGRVLYIGAFSKVLFPALRLGYLVAPTELIEPLLVMRRSNSSDHFARPLHCQSYDPKAQAVAGLTLTVRTPPLADVDRLRGSCRAWHIVVIQLCDVHPESLHMLYFH